MINQSLALLTQGGIPGAAAPIQGVFQGTVTVFNAEKGYGFLNYEGGNGGNPMEFYLHIKACSDYRTPQPGDIVKFDLEESKTKAGMMAACNVTGGSGPTADEGTGKGFSKRAGAVVRVPGQGALVGTVKSFCCAKGYGFLLPDAHGECIFFHHKQFVDGTTPTHGDRVTFDTEPSPLKPGQLQACNITGGTGVDTGAGDSGGHSGFGPSKGGGKGKGKGKGKDKGFGQDGGNSVPYGAVQAVSSNPWAPIPDVSQASAPVDTGNVGTVPADMLASLQALAAMWSVAGAIPGATGAS